MLWSRVVGGRLKTKAECLATEEFVYIPIREREREEVVEVGSERGGLLAFIPAV